MNAGQVLQGDLDDNSWQSEFDDSSGNGYTCTRCGAMVVRMEKFARLHIQWHQSLDGTHRLT